MPTAASYLRGNDYNTLKFSPFQLPVNDIAKTIMAKTQYWNEGASRIKSRYDDALGLSLSNPENQKIKKDYISKSEEMIKSMSSQNLGNPDVQQAGVGIFKNLFEDEGIMYDDQLTKHFDKVRTDYASLLKSDPSKASNRNLAYAMEDQQAFMNDPDRTSAKSYYNRRREYVPFYDPADDIERVMKNCHSNSNTNQSPYYGGDVKNPTLTGYDHKVSNKGVSEAQLSNCFSAGLSEQAKNQINIDGYMAFRNNKEGLAREYTNYLEVNNQALLHDKTDMGIKLVDLAKKKNRGIATQTELQEYETLKESEKAYADQINNNTMTMKRLNQNDFSPLDKDYEGIAGAVFSNIKNSQFGKAFAYNEFTEMYISSPAQMTQMNIAARAQQQALQNEFTHKENYQGYIYDTALRQMDINEAALKASGKKGTKEELIPIGINPASPLSVGPESPNESGYKEFRDNVDKVNGGISTNNEAIKNKLLADKEFTEFLKTIPSIGDNINMLETIKNLPAEELIKSNAFKQYLNRAKDNTSLYEDLNKWRQTDINLRTNQTILNMRSKIIEAKIDPAIKNLDAIKSIPNLVLSDGTTISAMDMHASLEGQSGKVKSQDAEVYHGGRTSQYINSFKIGDKEYSYKNIKDRDAILKYRAKIEVANEDNLKKLNSQRKKLYSDANYNTSRYFTVTNTDDDNVKYLDKALKSIPKGDSKEDGRISIYDPSTGDVMVEIPQYNANTEEGIKAVDAMHLGAKVEKFGDGTLHPNTFIIRNVPGFNESVKLGLSSEETESAIALKMVTDDAVKDERVKPGQTFFELPINVRNGLQLKDWKILSVKEVDSKGGTYIEYQLVDDLGNVKSRQRDPFHIMKAANAPNY